MDGTFGARLRQRREEQGIDLIAIAAQTKIKMSLLDALERGDVSHWPVGIFRRAYVRAYAQAISLDPDVVVREFLEVHPEPAEIVSTDAIASAVDSRLQSGPPTRLRYIVGSAFSSLARLRRTPVEGATPALPSRPAEIPLASPRKPMSAAPVPAPPILEEAVSTHPEPHPDLDDLGELLMTEPLRGEPGDSEAVPVEEMAPEVVAIGSDPADPAVAEVADEPLPLAMAESSPEPPATPLRERRKIDFSTLAQVCTGFAQVQTAEDLSPLLRDAARVLAAPGLIVWIWDPTADGLRAAFAHGYSDRVLAQFPVVDRVADNATAAAFRRGQICRTSGDAHTNSAIVVPLLTGDGCAGVLAVELPYTREHDAAVQAAATILAAMLAQLAVAPAPADTGSDFEPDLSEESAVRATAAR